jgi:type I restriction enzyme S subunit
MSSSLKKYSIEEIAEKTTIGPFGSRLKSNLYTNTGVPVIRGTNLTSGKEFTGDWVYISEKTADDLLNCNVIENDLVFPHRGAIGEVGIVPKDVDRYVLSSSIMMLRCNKEIADPDYIYYFFKSKKGRHELLKNASQVGTPGIGQPLSSLRNIEILLPEMKYQKKVSKILSSIDNKISNNIATNRTIEELTQALFKSWFVDFDPVKAKSKGHQPVGMDESTAALFPDSFEESELGMIPKGWEVKTMNEISNIAIGKTPPRKEPRWFSLNPEEIKWISIRDLGVSGTYVLQTKEHLIQDSIERFNIRMIPDNTVLLSFKMTIGRVAITQGIMTTNEAIAHFKLDNKSPLTSEYIYLYLKQFDYLRLSSTSSIVDAVNSKIVRGILILIPGERIRQEFQKYISEIFKKIKIIQTENETLTNLRDTLLPKLLSGELTFPEIEEEVLNI